MDYGFTDILKLFGSLGLFLYGMKVMSDALMELAGDRMRTILAAATSNRFFAALTGFVITAIIQSSSATSLMVVSFTNAGLMTLTEAIGVIMGANIGTTVTAWLISILGFKISMSAISIPLVGFGFLLTLAKDAQKRNWGLFIVGFALLFIGLDYLKNSVPDIGKHPEMLAFLAKYTTMGYLSVLLFLLIGTVLTLVIQSSSAAMALTLLMCHEGWIPYDMAAVMVLGQNVGTTITANLAAMIANYQARRAARAHFLFNLMGVFWGIVLLYPFLHAMDFIVTRFEGESPFESATAIPIALSLFHTAFNVANTVLLIAFVGLLARIVSWMVPAVVEPQPEIDEPVYLVETALEYPETAIKALQDESLRLLETTAYLAITHGLGVHREDVESKKKLSKILAAPDRISIDIEKLYTTKIKRIYSCILEYATTIQTRFVLDEDKIEKIRNILVANRMMVQVIKAMRSMHINIDRYMSSDNLNIQREYNVLRRRILKIVREIRRIKEAGDMVEHIENLKKQRRKAVKLDVLVSGRINKLVASGEIGQEMASSLMNDSANASQVAQMLVDIATLLYHPSDIMIQNIDEHLEVQPDGDGLGEDGLIEKGTSSAV